MLTRLAEDRGSIGFDFEYGFGIINGCRLANLTTLTASAQSEPSPGEETRRTYDSPTPFPFTKETAITQEEQQFMDALAAFEQSGTDTTAASVDVCGTYKKVKPILQGILPFIALIPGIGKAAAAAITALMLALDSFCPTA